MSSASDKNRLCNRCLAALTEDCVEADLGKRLVREQAKIVALSASNRALVATCREWIDTADDEGNPMCRVCGSYLRGCDEDCPGHNIRKALRDASHDAGAGYTGEKQ